MARGVAGVATAAIVAATGARAAELPPLPPRPIVKPAMGCAALARQPLAVQGGPQFKIASATVEPATGERAEFCLVKGYVAPQLQFELRLPTQGYTGRYLQSGCGAMCGTIGKSLYNATNDRRLYSGAFAFAFDNAGHVSFGDAVWAAGAPELRADFAYRSPHKTATVAKAVIAAFYGAPPAHSYFAGCSNGGRQGLTSIQRYPDDFDGVVVGSSISMPAVMNRYLWEPRVVLDANDQPIVTPAAARLLHTAVMAACDTLDGVKDGQIDDPRACRFDPASIQCKPGAAAASCLTPEQAEAARRLYAGPKDETGLAQFPGGAPYGSELDWNGPGGFSGQVRFIAAAFLQSLAFPDQLPETFGWKDWRFTARDFARLRRAAAAYEANSTDLSAFRKRGGKLLMWQGTADNTAGAYGMPEYYQALGEGMGGRRAVRDFARLFMVPAVYHCSGGYIPYETDLVGAMVAWVEAGRAPDSLLATATIDGKARERPVYAYPVRARYLGGDIDAATSFAPETPAIEPDDAYPWAGSPFAARARKR